MKIYRLGSQFNVEAPAKLNLFLEIHGKREDGFHEIDTVMTKVSLFDTLRFSPRSDGQINLSVDCSHPRRTMPLNSDNLIYRALNTIKTRHETPGRLLGADVRVSKRIPSSAGLGGASSDAAATLIAANHIWNLCLNFRELQSLGAELGSDIPFFLQGGAAICTGRGEIIQPVPAAAGLPVVIAMPPVGLSTPEIYRGYATGDAGAKAPKRSSQLVVETLGRAHWRRLADGLFNRLETVASEMTDWINRLKCAFAAIPGCVGFQMSGSGSSYFGVFPNQVTARQAANCLSNTLPDVRILLARTLGRWSGPHLPRANR